MFSPICNIQYSTTFVNNVLKVSDATENMKIKAFLISENKHFLYRFWHIMLLSCQFSNKICVCVIGRWCGTLRQMNAHLHQKQFLQNFTMLSKWCIGGLRRNKPFAACVSMVMMMMILVMVMVVMIMRMMMVIAVQQRARGSNGEEPSRASCVCRIWGRNAL